jgi:hypothetical protein
LRSCLVCVKAFLTMNVGGSPLSGESACALQLRSGNREECIYDTNIGYI